MREVRVDDELAKCTELAVALLCPDDDAYPALLKEIPDPPAVLYVRGAFEPRDLNAVAIVGSRKCSYYGREQAERFAALLAGAGFSVISGGARGIDSAAHRGAMSHAHGRTIAVLGSGIDVPYPPENAPLFEEIAKRGAVVSEYPLGTPPLKDNFPRRNRIVSGMSRGVLVIEADIKSGALITARQACDDHSRPVFALPGRVDNALSDGPHLLIRDGAVLTTKLEDIIENLGPLPHGASEPTLFEEASKPHVQAVEDITKAWYGAWTANRSSVADGHPSERPTRPRHGLRHPRGRRAAGVPAASPRWRRRSRRHLANGPRDDGSGRIRRRHGAARAARRDFARPPRALQPWPRGELLYCRR
jgi:DNA protecting protein DprA